MLITTQDTEYGILSCLMWYNLLCCYMLLLRLQLWVIAACSEPVASICFWYMPSDWHYEWIWLIVLFNNACSCINHGKCGCIWKSLEEMLLQIFWGYNWGTTDNHYLRYAGLSDKDHVLKRSSRRESWLIISLGYNIYQTCKVMLHKRWTFVSLATKVVKFDLNTFRTKC